MPSYRGLHLRPTVSQWLFVGDGPLQRPTFLLHHVAASIENSPCHYRMIPVVTSPIFCPASLRPGVPQPRRGLSLRATMPKLYPRWKQMSVLPPFFFSSRPRSSMWGCRRRRFAQNRLRPLSPWAHPSKPSRRSKCHREDDNKTDFSPSSAVVTLFARAELSRV